MLTIGPNQSDLKHVQLQSKIEELNQLESWGSWDVALVSESEMQSIIEESFKLLQEHPNKSLRKSLLKFTERVKSEEYVGHNLKNVASKVHRYLKTSTILPLPEEVVPQVLNKIGMKDILNLSVVSPAGNTLGKEAFLARIKQVGFKGDSYKEGLEYLTALIDGVRSLSRLKLDTSPVLNTVIDDKLYLTNGKDKNYESIQEYRERFGRLEEEKNTEIDRVISILETIKTLPGEEIIGLCAKFSFYNPSYDKLREFISFNFDIKTPLGVDSDAKKMQGNALCRAAYDHDLNIISLLLRWGVDPNSKFDDPSIKYNNKTAIESAEGANDNRKEWNEGRGYDNHEECIMILKKALKSS